MMSELNIPVFVSNVEEWVETSFKDNLNTKQKKYMYDSFSSFQAQLWAVMPNPLVKPHRKGVVPEPKIKTSNESLLCKSMVDVLLDLLLDIQHFARQVRRGEHKFKEGDTTSQYSRRKIAMETLERDLQSRINAMIRLMSKRLPRK